VAIVTIATLRPCGCDAKCENKFVIDKIEAICYTWNLLPFMGTGTQDYPNHLKTGARCASEK